MQSLKKFVKFFLHRRIVTPLEITEILEETNLPLEEISEIIDFLLEELTGNRLLIYHRLLELGMKPTRSQIVEIANKQFTDFFDVVSIHSSYLADIGVQLLTTDLVPLLQGICSDSNMHDLFGLLHLFLVAGIFERSNFIPIFSVLLQRSNDFLGLIRKLHTLQQPELDWCQFGLSNWTFFLRDILEGIECPQIKILFQSETEILKNVREVYNKLVQELMQYNMWDCYSNSIRTL